MRTNKSLVTWKSLERVVVDAGCGSRVRIKETMLGCGGGCQADEEDGDAVDSAPQVAGDAGTCCSTGAEGCGDGGCGDQSGNKTRLRNSIYEETKRAALQATIPGGPPRCYRCPGVGKCNPRGGEVRVVVLHTCFPELGDELLEYSVRL